MKTYVIHVSDAFERKKHISHQLEGKDLDIEFIIEGDIKDLSESVMSNYFTDKILEWPIGNASCNYKHILAYEKMMASSEELVLILEDDIYFESNFMPILDQLVTEIKQRKISNFMLSIEDSTLTYIPRSKRKKGILIYPEKQGRTTGAYLIDRSGVASILDEVQENKMGLPIDLFHNTCIRHNRLSMYWSHPTIAYQGTSNGSLRSLIALSNSRIDAMQAEADGNPESLIRVEKFGLLRFLSIKFQKAYKKLLYEFR